MLVRCTSLPFGWADSPRIFCAVTETIAAMVRRRCAGRGVHILAYVDDFLIVGDSEEAARYGGAVPPSSRQSARKWASSGRRTRREGRAGASSSSGSSSATSLAADASP
mmetsp:Transcript_39059/g.126266  ORF Transcript_39059/g.126266 Transcript_39059/m.126266 type:complete len:109 (+) Transcript_39059:332-658(+)